MMLVLLKLDHVCFIVYTLYKFLVLKKKADLFLLSDIVKKKIILFLVKKNRVFQLSFVKKKKKKKKREKT